MARTKVSKSQISGLIIDKGELNTSGSGAAVITQVIAGDNISLSSTGVDDGTGEVTINVIDLVVEFPVALGDESTAATTGTKLVWRAPCAINITSVRFECVTAPTGSVAILDVKESGTTIFSTKPQIAISATTSVGGAVPGVVSDASIADNAQLTFIIDQIGSTIAGAGYKATIIGTRV